MCRGFTLVDTGHGEGCSLPRQGQSRAHSVCFCHWSPSPSCWDTVRAIEGKNKKEHHHFFPVGSLALVIIFKCISLLDCTPVPGPEGEPGCRAKWEPASLLPAAVWRVLFISSRCGLWNLRLFAPVSLFL